MFAIPQFPFKQNKNVHCSKSKTFTFRMLKIKMFNLLGPNLLLGRPSFSGPTVILSDAPGRGHVPFHTTRLQDRTTKLDVNRISGRNYNLRATTKIRTMIMWIHVRSFQAYQHTVPATPKDETEDETQNTNPKT